MLRNIIFDWSGTLVDDLVAVWKSTNYVLSQAGLPEFSLAQFRQEFCLPFTKFYDRHMSHIPMAQLEQWFHLCFRDEQDSVVALPHALEFLVFCRERDVRTFLLSTVHSDHFEVQAAKTGFRKYLDWPYLGIWDKRTKILEMLHTHDMQPAETLFIGDMQHDIDTAKHGGIFSCGVLTGYNSLTQLRSSQPDLIVEHLGQLRDLLERTALQFTPEA